MKGKTLWKEILRITREEELPGARVRMDVDCGGYERKCQCLGQSGGAEGGEQTLNIKGQEDLLW